MQKYLITTLVTANDYTQGAIGLFFSLQKGNPDIPFCVMITKNVDSKPYEELNILTKTIEKKQFCEEGCAIDTINKFYAFSFIEYDKVLFFDADMVINEDISHIFNYEVDEIISSTYADINRDNLTKLHLAHYFLCKPSVQTMEKLLSLTDFPDDEFVLDALYGPETAILPNEEIFHLNKEPLFYHSVGRPKYWGLFKLDNNSLRTLVTQFPAVITLIPYYFSVINVPCSAPEEWCWQYTSYFIDGCVTYTQFIYQNNNF